MKSHTYTLAIHLYLLVYTFLATASCNWNQANLSNHRSSSSPTYQSLHLLLSALPGREASPSGIALLSLPLLPCGRNALTGTGTSRGAQPKGWE
ncbi:hypothetical protein [Pontibacter chinhatensis]|uniref:hypothetical protein n=1 Tax=Pontibacter chinhatensis TaxID=1436961 RepID=UPI000A54A69C|nr:hypothetical protein [Pontibacter chinhatensis]